MRRFIATALVALVGAVAFPLAAHAAEDTAADEAAFVSKINALRAGKGLATFAVDPVLTAKARAWAQTMADKGTIWHSNLPDGVTENWQRLGENVGMGGSVDSLHDAFVNSPHHYENLVDPGFRFVGLGVVDSNGTLYVSEVFMELASQPAPTASRSASGTPSSHRTVVRAKPVLRPAAATGSAPGAAPAAPPVAPPPPPEPSARLINVLEQVRSLSG